jgi:hypothetical protein
VDRAGLGGVVRGGWRFGRMDLVLLAFILIDLRGRKLTICCESKVVLYRRLLMEVRHLGIGTYMYTIPTYYSPAAV